MYELLLKGGKLIDPARGIHDRKDIGVSGGKIAAVAPDMPRSEAKRVIDVAGKIATPGLIDIHAHVADGIQSIGVPPDRAGVRSGVTAVCDAASTGYANFPGFKRYVISQAQTDVFCFLHICSTGMALSPAQEIWSWRNINPEATLRTIAANRDIIKGVKIRAVEDVVTNLGVAAIKTAKRVAQEARLPLMIHLGLKSEGTVPADKMDAFTREMLSLLDKGDILSHVYTGKTGGVIKTDGHVLPELREAMLRGVVLDVAQAKVNCDFDIAQKGLEQGILPTTISTDMTISGIDAVFSLPVTMSRFLALGLSLDQVVAMATINPARALGEEQCRGSLGVGMPADITIMEIAEGDFVFADATPGRTFKGNLLLVPRLTVKSGVEVPTEPRFQNAA